MNYKLKEHVTVEMLESVGFEIHDVSINHWYRCAIKDDNIYIPLEECQFGNRIIQPYAIGMLPEELNPEDIENLIEKGWVEVL